MAPRSRMSCSSWTLAPPFPGFDLSLTPSLLPAGDGWSARAEDAVLHGCVPVVIMDRVHAVFEPELDWAAFSIRVNESDIDKVSSRWGHIMVHAGSSGA